jgi:hypothetical protein
MKNFIFYAQVLNVYCKETGIITYKIIYYFPVDVPKACGLTLGFRQVRKCQQRVTPLASSLCYCTVILIVPNIPEHFRWSIIIVTILFYLWRWAMIIYFCGLTGAALFLIFNSICRIYSLINWEIPPHRKGRDVCRLIVSSDSLHTSKRTQSVSIIKIKHIEVIKSSRKFSVVLTHFNQNQNLVTNFDVNHEYEILRKSALWDWLFFFAGRGPASRDAAGSGFS